MFWFSSSDTHAHKTYIHFARMARSIQHCNQFWTFFICHIFSLSLSLSLHNENDTLKSSTLTIFIKKNIYMHIISIEINIKIPSKKAVHIKILQTYPVYIKITIGTNEAATTKANHHNARVRISQLARSHTAVNMEWTSGGPQADKNWNLNFQKRARFVLSHSRSYFGIMLIGQKCDHNGAVLKMRSY